MVIQLLQKGLGNIITIRVDSYNPYCNKNPNCNNTFSAYSKEKKTPSFSLELGKLYTVINVHVYNLPNSIENDKFSLIIANLLFYYNSVCFLFLFVFFFFFFIITKPVVNVYPNCNNVLATCFVINCYKTGFCYKTGCKCLPEL